MSPEGLDKVPMEEANSQEGERRRVVRNGMVQELTPEEEIQQNKDAGNRDNK